MVNKNLNIQKDKKGFLDIKTLTKTNSLTQKQVKTRNAKFKSVASKEVFIARVFSEHYDKDTLTELINTKEIN